MRILYLVPTLDHGGASRQLEILVPGMRAFGHEIQVVQFASAKAIRADWESWNIGIHSLNWCRHFDLVSMWRLRGLLRDFQPDLIHAWQGNILPALALIAPKLLPRVVLSQPFSWKQGTRFSIPDRWLLGKVARIVVQDDVEADLCQNQGLFLDKIAVIPSATCPRSSQPPLPPGQPGGRKIVCIGPLESHKGYLDALWAFDMVRYIFPDLRLYFLGEGPDQDQLRRFARQIECDGMTYFIGPCAEVAPYLEDADVCWVPSRSGGGTQAALEAMLAELPVVASNVPNLRSLITDGQNGFLVPPGDKVSFARRTRQIFLDPQLARHLASQARHHALNHFGPHLLIQRTNRMYHEVAA